MGKVLLFGTFWNFGRIFLIPVRWNLQVQIRSCSVATSMFNFFATLWTLAHQAPRSMGFPSKNSGVGCYHLLQSWPKDWTRTPCIAGRFFTTEPPGKPWRCERSTVIKAFTFLMSLCSWYPASHSSLGINSSFYNSLHLLLWINYFCMTNSYSYFKNQLKRNVSNETFLTIPALHSVHHTANNAIT